jgi:Na+/H+ antiporter NhaD/arsenite permease-like protein
VVAVTGALIVFVVTYVAIASRQLTWLGLDRPSGALVGAVAMVAVGGLSFPAAMAAIDLPVMTLLFGMLVIAGYLEDARFFRYTAYLVLTRARSARSLLWALTFTAGGLSASCSRRWWWRWRSRPGCRSCRTCWRWRRRPTSAASSAGAATRRT